MRPVRLSRAAEADLLEIGIYTLDVWGEEQSLMYLDSLDECFRKLHANPFLGRSCSRLRPGLRRIEHHRHVVFYRRNKSGVFISRILHERMLPGRAAFPGAQSRYPKIIHPIKKPKE